MEQIYAAPQQRRIEVMATVIATRDVMYYNPLRHGLQKRGNMGKRGPKPQGEAALTPAERQARYRAARQAGTPAVRYRKPGDRRSRPQRWRDAVAELVELQAACQDWLDSLPESLREGATAEALAAVCSLNLSELEGVEPPRGFGRD